VPECRHDLAQAASRDQGATAISELIEKARAQTRAIFKLTDRLDGGAATA
jgi:hypothetical protein